MKLKMQVTAMDGTVAITTVELPKLDMRVAVMKAALALDLDMADVHTARVVVE
jgi:hypothetical protein